MKVRDLDSLKQKAEELGTKYGLLDFPNQTKEVMRAYLGGGSSNRKEVERLKKNLEGKGRGDDAARPSDEKRVGILQYIQT